MSELNAKMAEVMGWKECKGGWDTEGKGHDVKMWTPDGELLPVVYLSKEFWQPDTDIGDTMLVVEKMIAKGWEFELQYTNVNELEGEPLEYEWWCSFIYYTDDENDHRYESAQGKDAALAICLAAEKAAEAE